MGFPRYDGVVVLDRNPAPGGAWQHRWDTLTMHDVHGIANLPGVAVPTAADRDRANAVLPDYFADDGGRMALPGLRPVGVEAVRDVDGTLLEVTADTGRWLTRAVVNATG